MSVSTLKFGLALENFTPADYRSRGDAPALVGEQAIAETAGGSATLARGLATEPMAALAAP